jgi:hypothetical protein
VKQLFPFSVAELLLEKHIYEMVDLQPSSSSSIFAGCSVVVIFILAKANTMPASCPRGLHHERSMST